jgi:hypothetical protein
VYAYATISLAGAISPGAILYGSFFLAAGCMKRSWFSSWLDRSSSDVSTSEGATVTTCLMAMVWQAVRALTSDPPREVIHIPDILNLCALASMTMMFVGAHESQALQMAQALCRHCKEQDLPTFEHLLQEFSDLKIANRAYNRANMDSEDLKDYDARSASLRKNMLEAIQHMVPDKE